MPSLSPLVPAASMGFNYFTANTTQDLTDVADLVNFVANSFTVNPVGGSNNPSQYLHPCMSRGANAVTTDVYDVTSVLAGGRAGSPVLVSSHTLSITTDTGAVPLETSAVITLQAPYGTDAEFGPGTRPRARDRGRIYFGPLGHGGLDLETTTNRCRITSGCRTDLTAWIKSIDVHTTSPHSVVYNLGVWSRKNSGMKSLQEIWIDDTPDTQRRRGGKAATKTVVAA